jgi:hypothetical protein
LVKPVERALLAVAFAILVAGAFFTPQLVTRIAGAPSSAESAVPVPAVPDVEYSANAGDKPDPGDASDGFTDLYGNEVTDAIATYTFDRSGSLYELHSPQTELPRLGIPKS